MSLENILFWPKLPGVLSSKTATKSPDVVLKIFVLKDGSKKSRHLVINIRLVAENIAARSPDVWFCCPKNEGRICRCCVWNIWFCCCTNSRRLARNYLCLSTEQKVQMSDGKSAEVRNGLCHSRCLHKHIKHLHYSSFSCLRFHVCAVWFPPPHLEVKLFSLAVVWCF